MLTLERGRSLTRRSPYRPAASRRYIANELGPFLFAVDPKAEGIIAEQADNLLQRHKDSLVLKETTYNELIENVRRSFRAARRDAQINIPRGIAASYLLLFPNFSHLSA